MGFLKDILFGRPKVQDLRQVLPPEAFEVSSVHMRHYRAFDPISRDVFCSWLLQSFAESRGNLPLQADYINLTGLNTNLNVRQSLRNFAYGTNNVFAPWMRLTGREQRAMTDAYAKLMKTEISQMRLLDRPYHKGLYVHAHVNIAERFDVQIKHVIARLDPKCTNLISLSRGMDIQDFRRQVEPHLKVYARG